MPGLFRPRATTLFRVLLLAGVLAPLALVALLLVLARSPISRYRAGPVAQPVEFDHRHHVGDDGIDCRYCHAEVERSPTAGYPSTSTCLGCHGQIWNESEILAPVREAFFEDASIPWRRVHRLPDFVFFDHSVHVAKGIGCVTCHGRVDLMPSIQQVVPLTMQWCLECHRDPVRHLRPVEEIAAMDWQPPPGQAGEALRRRLARDYDVRPRTSCTTCHR